eukprot:m.253545 g.253545  ORF g.253545 m.253545 type:complete len:93 (+) comp15932_c0_seq3:1347-1625(+)
MDMDGGSAVTGDESSDSSEEREVSEVLAGQFGGQTRDVVKLEATGAKGKPRKEVSRIRTSASCNHPSRPRSEGDSERSVTARVFCRTARQDM